MVHVRRLFWKRAPVHKRSSLNGFQNAVVLMHPVRLHKALCKRGLTSRILKIWATEAGSLLSDISNERSVYEHMHVLACSLRRATRVRTGGSMEAEGLQVRSLSANPHPFCSLPRPSSLEKAISRRARVDERPTPIAGGSCCGPRGGPYRPPLSAPAPAHCLLQHISGRSSSQEKNGRASPPVRKYQPLASDTQRTASQSRWQPRRRVALPAYRCPGWPRAG